MDARDCGVAITTEDSIGKQLIIVREVRDG